jgi:DNA topoisomerase-1
LLDKHQFKLTGKLLVSPGYLSLLEGKTVSEEKFPTINTKDLLHLLDDKSISLEQKFTQPPARYNYSSLIKELESKGIGRPSTYTEIISKITSRHYVEKQGNTYHGTKLGDHITTILTKYFDFMEYDYTAELEKQMDDISEGKLNNLTVLTDFYLRFQNKLKEAHLAHHGKMCDQCSAPMYLKNGKNDTKFWGCSLYPFCNFSAPVELKNCA